MHSESPNYPFAIRQAFATTLEQLALWLRTQQGDIQTLLRSIVGLGAGLTSSGMILFLGSCG